MAEAMAEVGDSYKGISRTECILALNTPDADQRISMMREIGNLGEAAVAYLSIGDEIAKQLDDPSPLVQSETLLLLGRLGEQGVKYGFKVSQRLHSSNTSVVVAALTALGMTGASRFASDVLRFVENTDESVATAAVVALGQMRASGCEEALLKCLKSPVPKMSCAACTALALVGGNTATAAAQIADLLTAQEPAKRCAALASMAIIGDASLKYGDAICKCLGDAHPSVRSEAVEYFSALRGVAQPLAKKVSPMLSTQDGCQKCAAAVALGYMGETAAAPDIAKLLSDDFADIESAKLYAACVIKKPPAALRVSKCSACQALSMLEAASPFADTIMSVVEATDDREIKEAGLHALGCMGKEGTRLESKVYGFIGDADCNIAAAALVSLGHMGTSLGGSSQEMVKAVAKKLKHPSPVVRTAAATALPLMGSAIKEHLDSLAKCFEEDRCVMVRIAAISGFSKCGKLGQLYAPLVGSQLADESPKVRKAAIESLSCMGDRGAALADEIAACLEDPDNDVCAAAITALGNFGPKAAYLLPYVNAIADGRSAAAIKSAAKAVNDKILESSAA